MGNSHWFFLAVLLIVTTSGPTTPVGHVCVDVKLACIKTTVVQYKWTVHCLMDATFASNLPNSHQFLLILRVYHS